MEPESLVNVASDLGAVVFVFWLAHRMTTKTIPDLTEKYIAATERQRQDFRDVLEKQRSDFAEWHQQDHAVHESRMDTIVETVRSMARESREH